MSIAEGSRAGSSGETTAMLVVTALPGHGLELARVRSTQDVLGEQDAIALVRSLPGLLSVVEGWWRAYWRPESGSPAPE